jgi:hypothetical protein
MGFIDDEQRDLEPLQDPDEGVVFQLFGGDEDDLHLTRGDPLDRGDLLVFRERRVERDGRRHPTLGQHVKLVLHQGDQRRDDDRRPAHQQRRKLIAQRLSGSRCQDSKCILSVHDARDHFFLTWVEALVTKMLAQRCAQINLGLHRPYSGQTGDARQTPH